jgi:hypothetical protein
VRGQTPAATRFSTARAEAECPTNPIVPRHRVLLRVHTGPNVATMAAREALRLTPLMETGWADTSRVKAVPLVAAGAKPLVLIAGRPAAERAPDARAGGVAAFVESGVAVDDGARTISREDRHVEYYAPHRIICGAAPPTVTDVHAQLRLRFRISLRCAILPEMAKMRPTPGQRLRSRRKALGLTLREIHEGSIALAEKLDNPEYILPASRLHEFEVKGVVPSIFRLYTLSWVYGSKIAELMGWYGIPRG